MYRKKCVEKILTGKIPGEFVPTYRKIFAGKILVGKFPVGKIPVEKITNGFVPGIQLSLGLKSGIDRYVFNYCRCIPDLALQES